MEGIGREVAGDSLPEHWSPTAPAEQLIEVGRNRPLLLQGDRMWIVRSGRVDVFAVATRNGEAAGQRRHLLRVESGQALFAIDRALGDPALALVGVGVIGTQLRVLDRAALMSMTRQPEARPEVVAWLDNWITGLYAGVVTGVPPKGCKLWDPGMELSLAQNGRGRPRQGVLWLKHASGSSWLLGRKTHVLSGNSLCPLSGQVWIQAAEEIRLDLMPTACLVEQEAPWSGLELFHRLILGLIQDNVAVEARAEQERLQRKAAANRLGLENALAYLAAVLEPELPVANSTAGEDPLLAACRLVGKAQGIDIHPAVNKTAKDPLHEIARASQMRVRQVALKGEWWRKDNGPLLVYRDEGKVPLAALPVSRRRYELVDPGLGVRTTISAEVAASLAAFGHVLTLSFPARPLTAQDLLKFGLRSSRSDLIVLLLAGLAMGLLALVTPLATGILFDTIIPGANRYQLLQIERGVVGQCGGGCVVPDHSKHCRAADRGENGCYRAGCGLGSAHQPAGCIFPRLYGRRLGCACHEY